jgi:hypothetical protein
MIKLGSLILLQEVPGDNNSQKMMTNQNKRLAVLHITSFESDQ